MQEELPKDFLVSMARKYGLTKLEEDAFVETFHSGRKDPVIIKILGLTLSAYRSRMGNVYTKFSFRDGGRGKRSRLHYFLCEEYQKANPNRSSNLGNVDIDGLVDELNDRLKDKIQNECGSMRVLAMTRPLELSNIFTEVNILEQVSRNQRLRVSDLLSAFQSGNDDLNQLGLGRHTVEKVSGLDYIQQEDKLLLLGRPGAGKTTFLKHIATQCNARKLFPNHLPIFIVLKHFAEADSQPSLLEYIIQEHAPWRINDYEIEGLLQERRLLLLLDGLDEVKVEDMHRVNQHIQSFTENFHGNRFLLTCRIAAQEYVFEQFTEVEIADFNEEQIEAFSRNWFAYKETPEKADSFLEKLQQNSRIQELATNPLLLTLLCLVFEVEADFPASRAELYSEGIYTLLRRWDASRNIERGQIYQELSVDRKIGLLSHIALKAFERSEIFFKKQTLATYIAEYIVHIPGRLRRKLLPYEMEAQAERVLRSIEAQHGLLVERAHGIYSFSHLSFQEYFAARAISYERNLEKIQLVFEQVKNKQWNEVFLLAVSMSPNADDLIVFMKQKIDIMLKDQSRLIDFFGWLKRKAFSSNAKMPQYFIRAFYFMYSISQEEVVSSVNSTPIHPEMDLDRALVSVINTSNKLLQMPTSTPEYAELCHKIELDLQATNRMVQQSSLSSNSFRENWSQIVNALPHLVQSRMFGENTEHLEDLRNWTKQLRNCVVTNRDIGHEWNFNSIQLNMLKEYYNASKLLMDCLSGDCYVSRTLQKQVRETLFVVAE
ncbi:NACHT domain-containing protein [Oscillatoria sp. CS-180]|uniref:NACHT domain-containing protein n=1 Tax=Oscillatoria sp. CS-180 TaxID=3021720 RepID=UPI00232E4098|nr:NACHT domain-containing protein [Oscillatoria sp. CS-180]MDB9525548.1 NACHT domain-containing protein [Oscillatoria sp. CS-180]